MSESEPDPKVSWSSRATLELVLEARQHRPEAWKALFERCESDMARFCRHFMGPHDPLRRLYETQDIVHEAFALAMDKIHCLQNDASFYAWVRTIIRRRIAVKRRDELRDKLGDGTLIDRAAMDDFEKTLADTDESVRVLDAVLELYPKHPEAMAVFAFLQFEEGCTPDSLAQRLEISRRTVYRRLEEATKLLMGRLT